MHASLALPHHDLELAPLACFRSKPRQGFRGSSAFRSRSVAVHIPAPQGVATPHRDIMSGLPHITPRRGVSHANDGVNCPTHLTPRRSHDRRLMKNDRKKGTWASEEFALDATANPTGRVRRERRLDRMARYKHHSLIAWGASRGLSSGFKTAYDSCKPAFCLGVSKSGYPAGPSCQSSIISRKSL